MILTGQAIKGTRIVKEATIEKYDDNASFRDMLEDCLIAICKEMDTSVPMWLKKNTTEFAKFRKAIFTKDQFVEKIKYDRLEIRLL